MNCEPKTAWLALPPQNVIVAAGISGAVFGAAFGLFTGAVSWAVFGTLLLAVAQAGPLTAGAAPYSTYQQSVAWIALWTTAVIAIGISGAEWWRGQSLHPAARFVVLVSGAVLFLKLLALLHPSKLLVDALFHAHRLEWVLGGRYYFTQPLPSGVQFPYAIALYVFASPWSALTRDHVALLRIVVCASQAVAGALIYPMVVRSWEDRRTAAAAVVLYHLVPLPYVIIGNANLTHAFGQSAALVTVAAATVWSLRPAHLLQFAGLAALASVAFLSHVGTFPLLLSTLVGIALLYRVWGGATLAVPARTVLLATALAVGFSIVSYYGHFNEIYKTFDRVRARPAASQPRDASSTAQQPNHPAGSAPARTPVGHRTIHVAGLGVRAIGWPILVLAVIGTWRVGRGLIRSRLGFTLLALGATCVMFLSASVLMPVDPQFERYTDEFVLRVYDATAPASVMLAAYGAVSAWESGLVARLAAAALLVVAGAGGVQQWMAWWH